MNHSPFEQSELSSQVARLPNPVELPQESGKVSWHPEFTGWPVCRFELPGARADHPRFP